MDCRVRPHGDLAASVGGFAGVDAHRVGGGIRAGVLDVQVHRAALDGQVAQGVAGGGQIDAVRKVDITARVDVDGEGAVTGDRHRVGVGDLHTRAVVAGGDVGLVGGNGVGAGQLQLHHRGVGPADLNGAARVVLQLQHAGGGVIMGVPDSVRAVVGAGSAVFVIEGAHAEITAVDLHRAAVRVGVGLLVADLYPVEGAAGEHPAGARFVVPTRNALAEVGVGPQLEVRPHGDRLVAGLIALRGEAAGAAGEVQGVDAGGGCVIAGVHRIGIVGGQVHHSAAADADNAVLVITRAQIKGDGVGVDRHRTAGDGDAVIPGVDTVAVAVGGGDVHRAAGDADAGKARLVAGIAGDPVIGIGQRDIGTAAH